MFREPTKQLRSATVDDVAEIHELVRSAYAKRIAVIGREPQPMNADYGKAVRENQVSVLCLGSEIAGVIEMMPRSDHLWIENLAVKPVYQDNRFERLLLAHGEQLAFVYMRKTLNGDLDE